MSSTELDGMIQEFQKDPDAYARKLTMPESAEGEDPNFFQYSGMVGVSNLTKAADMALGVVPLQQGSSMLWSGLEEVATFLSATPIPGMTELRDFAKEQHEQMQNTGLYTTEQLYSSLIGHGRYGLQRGREQLMAQYEKDKPSLAFARGVSEEAASFLGMMYPSGVMGRIMGVSAQAGSRAVAPLASAYAIKQGTKAGLSPAQMSAFAGEGRLMQEIAKRSASGRSLTGTLERLGITARKLGGGIAGLGTLGAFLAPGEGDEEFADISNRIASGLMSGALAVGFVGAGALAERLIYGKMMERYYAKAQKELAGLSPAPGSAASVAAKSVRTAAENKRIEALTNFISTGKGWNNIKSTFVASTVEFASFPLLDIQHSWELMGAALRGEDGKVSELAQHWLGTIAGGIMFRFGVPFPQLKQWQSGFPNANRPLELVVRDEPEFAEYFKEMDAQSLEQLNAALNMLGRGGLELSPEKIGGWANREGWFRLQNPGFGDEIVRIRPDQAEVGLEIRLSREFYERLYEPFEPPVKGSGETISLRGRQGIDALESVALRALEARILAAGKFGDTKGLHEFRPGVWESGEFHFAFDARTREPVRRRVGSEKWEPYGERTVEKDHFEREMEPWVEFATKLRATPDVHRGAANVFGAAVLSAITGKSYNRHSAAVRDLFERQELIDFIMTPGRTAPQLNMMAYHVGRVAAGLSNPDYAIAAMRLGEAAQITAEPARPQITEKAEKAEPTQPAEEVQRMKSPEDYSRVFDLEKEARLGTERELGSRVAGRSMTFPEAGILSHERALTVIEEPPSPFTKEKPSGEVRKQEAEQPAKGKEVAEGEPAEAGATERREGGEGKQAEEIGGKGAKEAEAVREEGLPEEGGAKRMGDLPKEHRAEAAQEAPKEEGLGPEAGAASPEALAVIGGIGIGGLLGLGAGGGIVTGGFGAAAGAAVARAVSRLIHASRGRAELDVAREQIYRGSPDARAHFATRFVDILSRYVGKKVEGQDTVGEKVAKEIKSVDKLHDRRLGDHVVDFNKIVKGVSGETVENAAKFLYGIEGKYSKEELALAEKVRPLLDEDLHALMEDGRVKRSGMELRGSGKPYGTFLNDVGRQYLKDRQEGNRNKHHDRVIQNLIKKGRATSVKEAEEIIAKRVNRSLIDPFGYFESTRFELPEDMLNFDMRETLPAHFRKSALYVEAVKQWGPDLETLRVDAKRMDAEGFAPAGSDLIKFIEDHFKPRRSTGPDVFYEGVGRYETYSKLSSPISALRNAFQPFISNPDVPMWRVAWHAGPKRVGRIPFHVPGLKELVPKQWREDAAAWREELQRENLLSPSEELAFMDNPNIMGKLALKLFRMAEDGNRYAQAQITKAQMEADLKQLLRMKESGKLQEFFDEAGKVIADTKMSRRFKTLEIGDRALNELLDNYAANSKAPPPKLFMEGIRRVIDDRQFRITMSTEHYWWRQPGMKLLFKFKSFTFNQLDKVINGVAVKELKKGNLAPMLQLATFGWLATYLIDEVAERFFGRTPSAELWSDQPFAAKAGTFLRRMFGGLGTPIYDIFSYGALDWAGGPALSSTLSALDWAKGVANENYTKATEAWIKKEFPALRDYGRLEDRFFGGTDLADKAALANARGRVWKHREDELIPTLARGALSTPGTEFPIERDTYYHRDIANYLLSGDVEDAALDAATVWNRYVDLDGDTPEKATSRLRQAMRRKLPGNQVLRAEWDEFLEANPDDADTITAVREEFEAGIDKVMDLVRARTDAPQEGGVWKTKLNDAIRARAEAGGNHAGNIRDLTAEFMPRWEEIIQGSYPTDPQKVKVLTRKKINRRAILREMIARQYTNALKRAAKAKAMAR